MIHRAAIPGSSKVIHEHVPAGNLEISPHQRRLEELSEILHETVLPGWLNCQHFERLDKAGNW